MGPPVLAKKDDLSPCASSRGGSCSPCRFPDVLCQVGQPWLSCDPSSSSLVMFPVRQQLAQTQAGSKGGCRAQQGRKAPPAGNVTQPRKDRGGCRALMEPGGQTQLGKRVTGPNKQKINRKQVKFSPASSEHSSSRSWPSPGAAPRALPCSGGSRLGTEPAPASHRAGISRSSQGHPGTPRGHSCQPRPARAHLHRQPRLD